MLLQRLVTRDELAPGDRLPSMYQLQSIRYVLDLDTDGRLLGPPIDTSDPADKTTKRGALRLAPHVKRANAIKPKLLADTAVWALGIRTEKDRPERVVVQQAAFRTLVEAAADATREPTVAAVARFLATFDPSSLPLPADFDAGQALTFRVDGTFPIDLPSVRAFWAEYTGAGATDDTDGAGSDEAGERLPCVVCGKVRTVLKRHPLKIKGIRGGQVSGTDLISANARAYESYGLENSLIAPTCAHCAESYANALNKLLADRATSLHTASTAHVFWADEAAGFQPGRLLEEPDSEQVRVLLSAPFAARAGALAIDEAGFHALGLSASGSRVVVRSWLDTTVGEAKRRLARWFALQQMVSPYGEPGEPLPLRRLANGTLRTDERGRPLGRNEIPTPGVVDALVGLALAGRPLPDEVLFAAVRRCRSGQEVTRERATLIRMVLGSQAGIKDGRSEPMPELDDTAVDPAYLCGRLLAILDAIQRRALGTANATVIDKFYGSASSAPASVFGTLLANAQNHLARLRKDHKGAYLALESRLEEVLEKLPAFPATLTLPEQALFALGYYHQRAADRRAARERGQAVAAGSIDVATEQFDGELADGAPAVA